MRSDTPVIFVTARVVDAVASLQYQRIEDVLRRLVVSLFWGTNIVSIRDTDGVIISWKWAHS